MFEGFLRDQVFHAARRDHPRVFGYKLCPLSLAEQLITPLGETEEVGRQHERQEEPKHQEHFLQEDVERQDALAGVRLHVGQLTNLKVAERHPREVDVVHPLADGREGGDDVSAEGPEVEVEKSRDDEELDDDVGQVEELHEEVDDDQVMAASFPVTYEEVLHGSAQFL